MSESGCDGVWILKNGESRMLVFGKLVYLSMKEVHVGVKMKQYEVGIERPRELLKFDIDEDCFKVIDSFLAQQLKPAESAKDKGKQPQAGEPEPEAEEGESPTKIEGNGHLMR